MRTKLAHIRQNLVYYLSMLVLLASLSLILLIFFWIVYPYKWLAYHPIGEGADFRVVTKQVERGGTLVYDISYCRWNDLSATFSKDIIGIEGNSNAISLQTFDSSFGANCLDGGDFEVVRVNSTMIPEILPPGKYIMRMKVTQQINPVRKLQLVVETEPFEIIEKGGETE